MRKRKAATPAPTTNSWYEENQRALSGALARVRGTLQRHIARIQDGREAAESKDEAQTESDDVTNSTAAPSALETLCATFHLSPFERDTLILCAGMELDSGFASLCAAAQGSPQRTFPTFSLALAALPNAHWSALTPAAPLRRWRLIEVGAGSALTLSPLRIDECILHYLAGVPHSDERLAGIIKSAPDADTLVPSQQAMVDLVARSWAKAADLSLVPVIQLLGAADKYAVATRVCAAMGLHLRMMTADTLPTTPSELEALTRLWERETALSKSVLLVDCTDLDHADAARTSAVTRLIERFSAPLLVAGRERRLTLQRPMLTFEIPKPSMGEQHTLWQKALGSRVQSLNGHLDVLVSQFDLSVEAIHTASDEVLEQLAQRHDTDLGRILWNACRAHMRPRLDDLAQRIEPAAAWDDLVLPEAQRQVLRDIAVHVRQRAVVYDRWGFAAKGARGLGVSALFTGASGTGKTMAAEVLAHELRLDLYRIDLASVVSKYIGETEKNLRRVFDAAEEGGAILLFDEADALFGKRSEVKDSHDRYANIEVSYLLQRMECYRGLAILTTNLKNALDLAFLRRIRFIVQFPFPTAAQRAEIWRRIFPAGTPTEGLDVNKLAQLNVAGGNIRNIALNAAFLAADAGEKVRMTYLLRAAHGEYAKLEKPLTDAEVAGWV